MWDLPQPGIEPMSPALAGGFLTTTPPGKPLFYFLNLLYWSIVDLQCCINFCCTAKSLIHIYIHSFSYSSPVSQDIEYSSLCYTVGPCCLSHIYIKFKIFQRHSFPCLCWPPLHFVYLSYISLGSDTAGNVYTNYKGFWDVRYFTSFWAFQVPLKLIQKLFSTSLLWRASGIIVFHKLAHFLRILSDTK